MRLRPSYTRTVARNLQTVRHQTGPMDSGQMSQTVFVAVQRRGQNLAVTVLYVPLPLDSGLMAGSYLRLIDFGITQL